MLVHYYFSVFPFSLFTDLKFCLPMVTIIEFFSCSSLVNIITKAFPRFLDSLHNHHFRNPVWLKASTVFYFRTVRGYLF